MGLLSSIASVVGNVTGGLLQNKMDKNSAKQNLRMEDTFWNTHFNTQANWEKEKMQNQTQWATDDLLKSGLNPALAAGGVGTGNMTAPNPGDPKASVFSTQNDKIATGLKAMQIANENRKMQAEIGNIQADTGGKLLNNEIVEKYGSEQAKENLANTLLEGQNLIATNALLGQQTATEVSKQILNKATAGKVYSEDVGISFDNSAKRRTQTWHDNHPKLSGFTTGYKEMRPIIQDVATAGGLLVSAKKVGGLADALNKTKVTERYNSKGKFKGATKSWVE